MYLFVALLGRKINKFVYELCMPKNRAVRELFKVELCCENISRQLLEEELNNLLE